MWNNVVTTSDRVPWWLRHRVFALAGLRKPIVHLTPAEQSALVRWAKERHQAVELGVAEGGSARLIADALAADATLEVVDPFFPGVLRFVAIHELVARRLLLRVRQTVRFTKALSWQPPRHRSAPIDFLFIDADHSESAVRGDWEAWSPWLTRDAIVALHDAVDPETGLPGPDGPGMLLRDLLANDWTLVDVAGSLAVIFREHAT